MERKLLASLVWFSFGSLYNNSCPSWFSQSRTLSARTKNPSSALIVSCKRTFSLPRPRVVGLFLRSLLSLRCRSLFKVFVVVKGEVHCKPLKEGELCYGYYQCVFSLFKEAIEWGANLLIWACGLLGSTLFCLSESLSRVGVLKVVCIWCSCPCHFMPRYSRSHLNCNYYSVFLFWDCILCFFLCWLLHVSCDNAIDVVLWLWLLFCIVASSLVC